MNRNTSILIVVLALVAIRPAGLFAQKKPKNSDIENIGKRDINKGRSNFASIANETRIGIQAAAEIERSVSLVDDDAVRDYVNRIAQNIANNSDSKFPITVKVILSNEVNASALPGGFIYVNSGAIRAADNEAELAYVIAQMVGHVAARHSTEMNSKDTLLQVASVPAIILTGGVAGTSLANSAQLGLPISMFRFSQDAVKEADFLGLEYLYKSGYDPASAVSFLKKLDDIEKSRPKQSSILATHPPAAERIKLVEKESVQVLPARTSNILNTPEFDAIKTRVGANTSPDSPTPSLRLRP